MSVRIRFARVGRPHAAFYRLVATPRTQARDKKPIEILGTFNPLKQNKPETIKLERLKYWLSVGATPTEGVLHALKTNGLWEQVKPGLTPPKS
jgi:small subunit ribosomal protein S16